MRQLTHLSGQTQLNTNSKNTASNISTANSSFKRNHQYDYDKVGRLTEHKLTDFIQQKGATERFAFDPTSNRVPISTAVDKESSENNNAVNNNIHKSGRPTKLVTADKLITYTYGTHGQVLFKTLTPAKDGKPIAQSSNALVSSRKSIQHYYNPNNELVKTITNTEEGFNLTEITATYYYDAFGGRIAKTSNIKIKTKPVNRYATKIIQFPVQKQQTKQQTMLMLWDGNRQAQEYTDTHVFTTIYEQNSFEPVARLVWLKDELLKPANDDIKNTKRESWEDEPKLIPNMQVYHYHNDHLGTPNELTNQDGEVVWLADYEAWGNTAKVVWREEKLEQLQVSKEYLQPIRFQGQYYDEETGLHYNRFRYFDPDLGMFISRDPIGLSGGINTFQYAPNPTGWIDPWGLAGTKLTKAAANSGYDYILELDSSVYPEAAGHIKDAIKTGHADIVTIDRDNAAAQRKKSLKGCACIPGKDRDEWPMAMFKEGGTGASIRGIGRSDNRGAGSSIGHALSSLGEGTKVKFVIK